MPSPPNSFDDPAYVGQPTQAREGSLAEAVISDESRPALPTLAHRLDETPEQPDSAASSSAKDAGGEWLLPPHIQERYEILAMLPKGGMGQVFRARDRRLKRLVALKVIQSKYTQNAQAKQRFLREAQAVAALSHPHIVNLYELDESVPYLTLEYVEGGDLATWLKANGPMAVETAVPLVIDLCDALHAAHTHPAGAILHRDVKPANVLLAKGRGGQWLAKLCDFGLASLEAVDGHTQSGSVLGTWDYMAPEQLRSATHSSPRSDQWSLAATLFTLVTDRSPRTDLLDLDDLGEPLQSILRRALRSDPDKRFGTLLEFGDTLGDWVSRRTPSQQTDYQPHSAPLSKALPPATDFVGIVQAMQTRVSVAHEEAQRLIEVEYDFASAVEVLSEVPEHLRNAELLRLAMARRDRVAELDREIEQRVRELRLQDLQPLIDELLGLQPNRANLRSLLATVNAEMSAQAGAAGRGTNAGERKVLTIGGIEYAFRWCPSGKFTMGSPPNELPRRSRGLVLDLYADPKKPRTEDDLFVSPCDENQVTVELKKCFWMQETVVTQKMWRKFMRPTRKLLPEDNPAALQSKPQFGILSVPIFSEPQYPWERWWKPKLGDDFPATNVEWSDATLFCEQLTAAAKEASALPISAKFRLPTEAEWEYACRAGTTTMYPFGNNEKLLKEHAWFGRNSNDGLRQSPNYVHQVGKKTANPWGLFDMQGNVGEWCQDWYAEKLIGGLDPTGPSSGSERVVRGGSFESDESYCRCANRGRCAPSGENFDYGQNYALGFRLVLEV